jgi:uncharacterized protein YdaT
MSISAKRRETEVFSLAFLDCICCGFGAMILVFILTINQKTATDKENVDDLKARVKEMQHQVDVSKGDIDRLNKLLASAQLELEAINAENSQQELKLSDRRRELLLLLQQTGMLKDALAKLLADKKALPTDENVPIAIPNIDRRQYLTGVRLEGDYVLFVIRASGSMLDDTIDAVTARLQDPDYKKREAPKWQRAMRALEWMLANLGPETRFQIVFFADDVMPILPARADEWFSTKDKQAIAEIVARIHEIVPQGSANLEHAFTYVRTMQRLPDNIVLFTDGLPTSSDSLASGGTNDDETRIRFFHAARKQLPARIPISTILFPLNGDPAAAALFWELANATRGALVSPSKSWPDT